MNKSCWYYFSQIDNNDYNNKCFHMRIKQKIDDNSENKNNLSADKKMIIMKK